FSTNFALPVSRLGSLRPQAPRIRAIASAPSARTVLRVRLTGREHYPLDWPDAAAITPSATLSQEYRRAASEASAARASSAPPGAHLRTGTRSTATLLTV